MMILFNILYQKFVRLSPSIIQPFIESETVNKYSVLDELLNDGFLFNLFMDIIFEVWLNSRLKIDWLQIYKFRVVQIIK